MDKNIPLSELIRIGAKVSKQCHGTLFERGRTCALGAALLAKYGGDWPEAWPNMTIELAAYPLGRLVKHPVSDRFHTLEYVITTLNDTDHWSRERIADWLKTVGL